MMRPVILIAATALGLTACAAPVPDSGRGVGYSDYSAYELERARREAELTRPGGGLVPAAGAGAPVGGTPAANAIATAPAAGPAPALGPNGAVSSADLAAAGIGSGTLSNPSPIASAPLSGTAPGVIGADPDRTAGIQASPTNAAPAVINNGGISDEQDFNAVASRESIESDAARLAENAAAYRVVQPTALPTRAGDGGPNIVQYALSAPNARGQQRFNRVSLFGGQGRFQRNCASYRSPDEAQRDFLARGGPERDPRGLDPDGDGFACGWDPAPFRAVTGN